MALTDYSIDTSGSPQDVQRRQAYADALLKQAGDNSPIASPWQGVNRLAQGLLGGIERGQARQEEQQGRAGYQQQLASALGNGGNISPQAMIALSGNQWANPAQLQTITHVSDAQRQSARDAVADKHWSASYELQKRSADRADRSTSDIANERAAAASAYGLQPGTPAYQAYTLTGTLPDPNKNVPNSVAEYGYYTSTFKPSAEQPAPMDYATFSTQKARAGATNISNNVDMNSGQTYDKQLAEGLGKAHSALATGVEDSQARARDVAAMQGAIDAIQKNGGTTGGLAPNRRLELQKSINAGLSAIGIEKPFDEKDLSDKEFLTKFNRQMAGAQAKGAVGSRVTNFEMANYLKANPGLEMSITGNQRLLGIQAQIEQRNVAVGNAIREATAKAISAGKKIDPVTVQKIVTDFDESHHIQDPVTGQDLTQSYVLPEFQNSGSNSGLAGQHEKNIAPVRIWDPATGKLK